MIRIYVENQELDLFQDESIELNKSIKRLTDIGSVYAPFTQSFTIPASRTNNAIFKHYYRDDLDQAIGNFRRIEASITLNGVEFERGSISIDGARVENGVPKSYTISFYGSIASLSEVVGGDNLNVLDLSTYDHEYSSSVIESGLDGTGLSSGDIIYPLFSPVRRWVYNTDSSALANNIAWDGGTNTEGVNYFELKPAIKVTKILEAIEDYYGFTFTGSFLSSSPFTALYMWLHNREGYIYEGQDGGFTPLTNREIIRGLSITNTANSPIQGIPVSQQATFITTQIGNGAGVNNYLFEVNFSTLNNPCVLYLTLNGQIIDQISADTTSTAYVLGTGVATLPLTSQGDVFRIQVGKTTANLTYQATLSVDGQVTPFNYVSCTMSSSVALTENVIVGNLVPEIGITDFLNGLIKMYNLIVTSEDGTTYNFQTRDDYYGAGEEIDLDRWLDTREIEVSNPPKYRALNFTYEPSNQVLQKRYRTQTGRGYGDLVQSFNFDSPETYNVKVPFDHLFTEKLTNQATATSLVDFTVYQSIEIDENGVATSYYGAPVLFYKRGTLDISSNSISLVDETTTASEITTIFFCEDVDDTTATSADSTTFSQEINPYLEQEPNTNLYASYWSSQISNTYDSRTRVYNIEANINYGLLTRLDLNDTILWRGRKYLIDQMNVNLTTGKAKLTLVSKVA